MNTSHPRFAQRLQNGGLLLLALGVTVHIVDHQTAAIAGLCVTLALLARLWIELSIRGDEADERLERQLHRMGILTQISCLIACLGLLGLIRDQK
jgi:hypothetical protein